MSVKLIQKKFYPLSENEQLFSNYFQKSINKKNIVKNKNNMGILGGAGLILGFFYLFKNSFLKRRDFFKYSLGAAALGFMSPLTNKAQASINKNSILVGEINANTSANKPSMNDNNICWDNKHGGIIEVVLINNTTKTLSEQIYISIIDNKTNTEDLISKIKIKIPNNNKGIFNIEFKDIPYKGSKRIIARSNLNSQATLNNIFIK